MMELARGTVRAFDAGTKTATVELEGSALVYVSGVPVDRGIPDAEVVAGRWCVVAVIDAHKPAGWMVLGVW